ncbi:MAG: Nif11-like leader peptide family RiPP precursor [Actinomycetia bacterium]|nr:Nif11-like leader peptide family RiPP precursor [Actinomycetes bacterium]
MSKSAFVKRFAEDKAFAEKFLGLDDLDSAKAFLADEGFEFSDEDVSNFLSETAKLKDECLSDDELDDAVGGLRDDSLFLSGDDAAAFRDGANSLLRSKSGLLAPESESFRNKAGLR